MNEFKQKAGGGTSILISFYPHPATVLKGVELPCITSLRQKLDCLSAEEVDVLYLIRFTRKFSELSAEDFIKSVLVEQLNVDHMVLGPDAAIGRGRGGDTDFIESSLKQLGRSCEKLEFLDLGQERISSRRIRSTISSGDVTTVAQMLGRPFALDARVIAGDGRGRGIGFPTANLKSHGQIVPPGGVYATLRRQAYGCRGASSRLRGTAILWISSESRVSCSNKRREEIRVGRRAGKTDCR
jgi:riboflavin kinase / FMN adenylyltransferase